MRSPADMDIVVIDLHNKCFLNCSHCTRLIAHQPKKWELDLPTFANAVESMRGWERPNRVLGLIAGEPTLHTQFEEISRRFAELWGGPLFDIGREPIADFNAFANERLFDRRGGRGLWTSLGPGFYRHYETIVEVYGHWNTNTHDTGGLHQANLISREDYCRTTGMSDEQWERNRDNCWVQNLWSASINDKGAYFCEHAAAIDRLFYDGKHAWPVEQGWWQRTPADFKDQIHLCNHCSLAQPGPSQVDATERDIVSPQNLVQLEIIGSPAVKKGQFDTFDASFVEQRTVATKDSYVGDGVRVGPDNRSAFPKRLALVVTCVGYGEQLRKTFPLNAPMFDECVVVGDPEHLPCDAKLLSDDHTAGDSAFNKGHLLNAALTSLRNPDWILFADADVILHPDTGNFIRSHALNPGCLHWTDRYDVHPESIDQPIGQIHDFLSREPNGYFQLFNRRALSIRDRWPRVMSENFCSAGGIDSWFAQQFPVSKWVKLNLPVRHIINGTALGQNWNGNPDKPCWRQIGLMNHSEMELLVGAPKNFRDYRLRLTDTKFGESLYVDPHEPFPVEPTMDGLYFGGKWINGCHVHVAAWI